MQTGSRLTSALLFRLMTMVVSRSRRSVTASSSEPLLKARPLCQMRMALRPSQIHYQLIRLQLHLPDLSGRGGMLSCRQWFGYVIGTAISRRSKWRQHLHQINSMSCSCTCRLCVTGHSRRTFRRSSTARWRHLGSPSKPSKRPALTGLFLSRATAPVPLTASLLRGFFISGAYP